MPLTFLLSCISGVLRKAAWAFFLWFTSPPLLYVAFAWIFVSDCDVHLRLLGQIPDVEDSEKTYYENKVCFVTGASSGIGRSIALLLIRRGAFVILAGRNVEELQITATEGARAHLVSEIRAFRRTESAVSEVVSAAAENLRTMVLPLDFDKGPPTNEEVGMALEWKGRIDMIFNCAGVGQFGLLSSVKTDDAVFNVNFRGSLSLTKALIPTALKPAAPIVDGSPVSSAFPGLKRFTSTQISNVSMYIRRQSWASVRSSVRFIGKSSIGASLHKIIYGNSIEYSRTFTIVNICTVHAKLLTAGRTVMGVASSALADYCRGISNETRGLVLNGSTKSNIVCTNCYVGDVRTKLWSRQLRSNGEPAACDETEFPGEAMNAERCALLVLRAACNDLKECWIGTSKEVLKLYIQYYMPWLSQALSTRFFNMDDVKAVHDYEENFSD